MSGKLRERLGTSCEPMAAGREAAVRDERRGYDWSAEPTHLRVEDVSPRAVEEARRSLTEAADAQSRRRAEFSIPDLLRECAVLDGDSYLSRAGALLFCPAPALASDPSVHYLRLRVHASDCAVTSIKDEGGHLCGALVRSYRDEVCPGVGV